MKFKPTNKHILIKPDNVDEVLASNGIVQIVQSDRSIDNVIKAVNSGKIVSKADDISWPEGTKLIYYPYAANKITIDPSEPDYHVIHERDVMGIVEE